MYGMSVIEQFRRAHESYQQRIRFWRTLPNSSTTILGLFIFLFFCAVGLIGTVPYFRVAPLWLFSVIVVTRGLFALGYAWIFMRRVHWLWILAIIPTQLVFNSALDRRLQVAPNLVKSIDPSIVHRLAWTTTTSNYLLIASCVLVLRLITHEGRRYFKVHAEMQLASEIHRTLVPNISMFVPGFEIYGLSLPSGEVGGDLVDVVVREGQWVAYIADVSGHGVSSGVLMAMLKSATRMSLRQNSTATKMLNEVNEVFYSLKAPNAFATFAAISCTEQRGLEVLVAGHLPVLRCDGRDVTELDTPGLPVGIMPDADFRAVTVELSGGEVLAIVTDGLTEVFNTAETELGLTYIKQTLLRECDRPLEQIAKSLLAQAKQWGPRSDDQSLLLVRRLPALNPSN
jgi:hypothetical protein